MPKEDILGKLKSIRPTVVAQVLGVALKTVYQWAETTDIPRNKDGKTYDLPSVVRWIRARDRGKDRTTERADAELARIQGQADLIKARYKALIKETIPRARVIELHKQQAYELKAFWVEGVKQNSRKLAQAVGLPVSKAKKVEAAVLEFLKEGIENFVASGKRIEEL